VDDLDVHLPAMRMTCEREFDPQLGCRVKRVGIMRQQDVGHIAAHQRRNAPLRRHSRSGELDTMLVVNTDEVEHRSVPCKLSRRLPEQAHTEPMKQLLCLIFNSGINFVIAVAAPYAERRFQKREFRDARLERVAATRDKVSGNNGEMCS
jgi:hypothetical protein